MRQDYIMRMIEEVGRAIRRIIHQRQAGQDDEALRYIMHCLERHLGLDAERMAQSSPQRLLELLTVDQAPEDARDRCLAFAALQQQAGQIYRERGAKSIAQAAFYLALIFALHAWTSYPQGAAAAGALSLEELLGAFDERLLPPDVRERVAVCRAMRAAPAS